MRYQDKLVKRIQAAPLFAAVVAYTLLPSFAQAMESVTVTPLGFKELPRDSYQDGSRIIPVRQQDSSGIFVTNEVATLSELANKWGVSERDLLTHATVVYGNAISSLGYFIEQNGPDLTGIEIKIGWIGNQQSGYRPVSYPEARFIDEPGIPVGLFGTSHMDVNSYLGLQKRAQYLASFNRESRQKNDISVDQSFFDTGMGYSSDERVLGLELRGDIKAAYNLFTDFFSDIKSFKPTDGELSLNMFALSYNENLRNAQRNKGLYRISKGSQLFISPLITTNNATFPGYANLIQKWGEHGYSTQYALNAVEAAGGAIAWEYVLAIGGGAAATAAVATTASSSSSSDDSSSNDTSSTTSSTDSTNDDKKSGGTDDDRSDDSEDDHDGNDDNDSDSNDDRDGDSDSGRDSDNR